MRWLWAPRSLFGYEKIRPHRRPGDHHGDARNQDHAGKHGDLRQGAARQHRNDERRVRRQIAGFPKELQHLQRCRQGDERRRSCRTSRTAPANSRSAHSQDYQKKQNELLGPIIEKAKAAIDQVFAAANAYTVVFDTSTGSLAYFDEATLTDVAPQVKKELGITDAPAAAPAAK